IATGLNFISQQFKHEYWLEYGLYCSQCFHFMTTTVLGIIYYKIIRTQGHYYMVKKLKKPRTHWHNRLCSYDSDWARTNDLMPVKHALSQLSYGIVCGLQHI